MSTVITARLSLVLLLSAGLASSSANAGSLQPEVGIGMNGWMALGELASVSKLGYGGDIMLNLVHEGGGPGLRAAGGLLYFQSDKVGTGQVIYNGTGTQESRINANHDLKWIALGPEWSTPVGDGHLDYYLLAGTASVEASSSGTYFNVAGPDPGTSSPAILLAGAMWSMSGSRTELGVEIFRSGRATIWGDPPIVSDGAGGYVTRSRKASITGAVLRYAYHFGPEAP